MRLLLLENSLQEVSSAVANKAAAGERMQQRCRVDLSDSDFCLHAAKAAAPTNTQSPEPFSLHWTLSSLISKTDGCATGKAVASVRCTLRGCADLQSRSLLSWMHFLHCCCCTAQVTCRSCVPTWSASAAAWPALQMASAASAAAAAGGWRSKLAASCESLR
jgi:hypothetical protein